MKFKFPDVGEGIHEGTIVKWLVKEGERVKADQTIVEVETDKAVVELPSPTTGRIKKINFKEGEIIKVGEVLVEIEEELGENVEEKREQKTTRVLASPSTRKLARELGIDIKTIEGSGPGGRILKEDVLNTAKKTETITKNEEVLEKKKEIMKTDGIKIKIIREKEDKIISLTHLRRVIAERMTYSKQHIPHACGMDFVDVTDLVKIREKEKKKVDIKITYLPFVMKAATIALKKYPEFNAHFDEEAQELVLKKKVNIGFAVDTKEGLIVPVIKNIENKSLVNIAKELLDLSNKARERKLSLEDLQGSTFTITNIGSLGGMYSTPIINPPEVAILGMHRIKDMPLVINNEIVPRKVMGLSICFDHRVIDGAQATRFMNEIKRYLEDPDLLLMEMV